MIKTNVQVTLVPIYKSGLPNKSLKSLTHRSLYSAAAIQMGTGSTGSKQMQTVSTDLSSPKSIMEQEHYLVLSIKKAT